MARPALAATATPWLRRAGAARGAEALLQRPALAAGQYGCAGTRLGLCGSRMPPTATPRTARLWLGLRCRLGGTSSEQAGSAELDAKLERLVKAAESPKVLQEFFSKAPPEVRGVVAREAFRALTEKGIAHDVEAFMAQLTSDEARTLGFAALSRHFGTDFKEEFEKADLNKSGSLQKAEFTRYFLTLAASKHSTNEVDRPSNRQLLVFAMNSAIPFLIFGCLDNSIMILGGDVVDDLIGSVFQLSTLACAALANTFADVFGISIGNTVEANIGKLGLPLAHLTPRQAELPLVRRIGLASGSFGIFVGCLMGMTPLLFMDQDRKALKTQFSKADRDGVGSLEVSQLVRVMERAGYEEVSEDKLNDLINELGICKGGRVSMKDFLENSKRLVIAFR